MVLTQLQKRMRNFGLLWSFHTTMVLTQQRDQDPHGLEVHVVSIPLWFLRNKASYTFTVWTALMRFPYHYGSYATQRQSSSWRQPDLVSIPLWFLRNEKLAQAPKVAEKSFHTTMVLTQRGVEMVAINKEAGVSIPLWFLRNIKWIREVHREVYLFPYHYGSYATVRNNGEISFVSPFPYHYGSYATQYPRGDLPLDLQCFHTTMVLTQPLLLQRYYTGFGEAESTNWEDLVSDIEFTFRRFAWIWFLMDAVWCGGRKRRYSLRKNDREEYQRDTPQQKLTEEKRSRFRFQSNDLSSVESV